MSGSSIADVNGIGIPLTDTTASVVFTSDVPWIEVNTANAATGGALVNPTTSVLTYNFSIPNNDDKTVGITGLPPNTLAKIYSGATGGIVNPTIMIPLLSPTKPGYPLIMSSDGIKWAYPSSIKNPIMPTSTSSICWNIDRWVAAGSGTQTNYITSTNGIQWSGSTYTNPFLTQINDIAFDDTGMGIAVGSGSTYNITMILGNQVWFPIVFPTACTFSRVIKTTKWIALSSDSGSNGGIYESYNGIDWTQIVSGQSFKNIDWDSRANVHVAIGDNSVYIRSSSGVWTSNINAFTNYSISQFYDVKRNDSDWLLSFRYEATHGIFISEDGVNWDNISTAPTFPVTSLYWDGSKWIGVGTSIATSPDYMNWTTTAMPGSLVGSGYSTKLLKPNVARPILSDEDPVPYHSSFNGLTGGASQTFLETIENVQAKLTPVQQVVGGQSYITQNFKVQNNFPIPENYTSQTSYDSFSLSFKAGTYLTKYITFTTQDGQSFSMQLLNNTLPNPIQFISNVSQDIITSNGLLYSALPRLLPIYTAQLNAIQPLVNSIRQISDNIAAQRASNAPTWYDSGNNSVYQRDMLKFYTPLFDTETNQWNYNLSPFIDIAGFEDVNNSTFNILNLPTSDVQAFMKKLSDTSDASIATYKNAFVNESFRSDGIWRINGGYTEGITGGLDGGIYAFFQGITGAEMQNLLQYNTIPGSTGSSLLSSIFSSQNLRTYEQLSKFVKTWLQTPDEMFESVTLQSLNGSIKYTDYPQQKQILRKQLNKLRALESAVTPERQMIVNNQASLSSALLSVSSNALAYKSNINDQIAVIKAQFNINPIQVSVPGYTANTVFNVQYDGTFLLFYIDSVLMKQFVVSNLQQLKISLNFGNITSQNSGISGSDWNGSLMNALTLQSNGIPVLNFIESFNTITLKSLGGVSAIKSIIKTNYQAKNLLIDTTDYMNARILESITVPITGPLIPLPALQIPLIPIDYYFTISRLTNNVKLLKLCGTKIINDSTTTAYIPEYSIALSAYNGLINGQLSTLISVITGLQSAELNAFNTQYSYYIKHSEFQSACSTLLSNISSFIITKTYEDQVFIFNCYTTIASLQAKLSLSASYSSLLLNPYTALGTTELNGRIVVPGASGSTGDSLQGRYPVIPDRTFVESLSDRLDGIHESFSIQSTGPTGTRNQITDLNIENYFTNLDGGFSGASGSIKEWSDLLQTICSYITPGKDSAYSTAVRHINNIEILNLRQIADLIITQKTGDLEFARNYLNHMYSTSETSFKTSSRIDTGIVWDYYYGNLNKIIPRSNNSVIGRNVAVSYETTYDPRTSRVFPAKEVIVTVAETVGNYGTWSIGQTYPNYNDPDQGIIQGTIQQISFILTPTGRNANLSLYLPPSRTTNILTAIATNVSTLSQARSTLLTLVGTSFTTRDPILGDITGIIQSGNIIPLNETLQVIKPTGNNAQTFSNTASSYNIQVNILPPPTTYSKTTLDVFFQKRGSYKQLKVGDKYKDGIILSVNTTEIRSTDKYPLYYDDTIDRPIENNVYPSTRTTLVNNVYSSTPTSFRFRYPVKDTPAKTLSYLTPNFMDEFNRYFDSNYGVGDLPAAVQTRYQTYQRLDTVSNVFLLNNSFVSNMMKIKQYGGDCVFGDPQYTTALGIFMSAYNSFGNLTIPQNSIDSIIYNIQVILTALLTEYFSSLKYSPNANYFFSVEDDALYTQYITAYAGYNFNANYSSIAVLQSAYIDSQIALLPQLPTLFTSVQQVNNAITTFQNGLAVYTSQLAALQTNANQYIQNGFKNKFKYWLTAFTLYNNVVDSKNRYAAISNIISAATPPIVAICDGKKRNFIVNILPTDTTRWALAPSGTNEIQYNRFNTVWKYYLGDIVSYKGVAYKCINTDRATTIKGVPPEPFNSLLAWSEYHEMPTGPILEGKMRPTPAQGFELTDLEKYVTIPEQGRVLTPSYNNTNPFVYPQVLHMNSIYKSNYSKSLVTYFYGATGISPGYYSNEKSWVYIGGVSSTPITPGSNGVWFLDPKLNQTNIPVDDSVLDGQTQQYGYYQTLSAKNATNPYLLIEPYSDTGIYEIGDIVSYEGLVYTRLANGTTTLNGIPRQVWGIPPSSPISAISNACWEARPYIDLNNVYNSIPQYSPTEVYVSGDFVIHKNMVYKYLGPVPYAQYNPTFLYIKGALIEYNNNIFQAQRPGILPSPPTINLTVNTEQYWFLLNEIGYDVEIKTYADDTKYSKGDYILLPNGFLIKLTEGLTGKDLTPPIFLGDTGSQYTTITSYNTTSWTIPSIRDYDPKFDYATDTIYNHVIHRIYSDGAVWLYIYCPSMNTISPPLPEPYVSWKWIPTPSNTTLPQYNPTAEYNVGNQVLYRNFAFECITSGFGFTVNESGNATKVYEYRPDMTVQSGHVVNLGTGRSLETRLIPGNDDDDSQPKWGNGMLYDNWTVAGFARDLRQNFANSLELAYITYKHDLNILFENTSIFQTNEALILPIVKSIYQTPTYASTISTLGFSNLNTAMTSITSSYTPLEFYYYGNMVKSFVVMLDAINNLQYQINEIKNSWFFDNWVSIREYYVSNIQLKQKQPTVDGNTMTTPNLGLSAILILGQVCLTNNYDTNLQILYDHSQNLPFPDDLKAMYRTAGLLGITSPFFKLFFDTKIIGGEITGHTFFSSCTSTLMVRASAILSLKNPLDALISALYEQIGFENIAYFSNENMKDDISFLYHKGLMMKTGTDDYVPLPIFTMADRFILNTTVGNGWYGSGGPTGTRFDGTFSQPTYGERNPVGITGSANPDYARSTEPTVMGSLPNFFQYSDLVSTYGTLISSDISTFKTAMTIGNIFPGNVNTPGGYNTRDNVRHATLPPNDLWHYQGKVPLSNPCNGGTTYHYRGIIPYIQIAQIYTQLPPPYAYSTSIVDFLIKAFLDEKERKKREAQAASIALTVFMAVTTIVVSAVCPAAGAILGFAEAAYSIAGSASAGSGNNNDFFNFMSDPYSVITGSRQTLEGLKKRCKMLSHLIDTMTVNNQETAATDPVTSGLELQADYSRITYYEYKYAQAFLYYLQTVEIPRVSAGYEPMIEPSLILNILISIPEIADTFTVPTLTSYDAETLASQPGNDALHIVQGEIQRMQLVIATYEMAVLIPPLILADPIPRPAILQYVFIPPFLRAENDKSTYPYIGILDPGEGMLVTSPGYPQGGPGTTSDTITIDLLNNGLGVPDYFKGPGKFFNLYLKYTSGYNDINSRCGILHGYIEPVSRPTYNVEFRRSEAVVIKFTVNPALQAGVFTPGQSFLPRIPERLPSTSINPNYTGRCWGTQPPAKIARGATIAEIPPGRTTWTVQARKGVTMPELASSRKGPPPLDDLGEPSFTFKPPDVETIPSPAGPGPRIANFDPVGDTSHRLPRAESSIADIRPGGKALPPAEFKGLQLPEEIPGTRTPTRLNVDTIDIKIKDLSKIDITIPKPPIPDPPQPFGPGPVRQPVVRTPPKPVNPKVTIRNVKPPLQRGVAFKLPSTSSASSAIRSIGKSLPSLSQALGPAMMAVGLVFSIMGALQIPANPNDCAGLQS